MTDTLRASIRGLALVNQARRQKKWTRTASIWLETAYVSRSTLNRFWARQPIQRENFISICQAVGVGWEQVAEPEERGAIAPIDAPLTAASSPQCLGREAILQRWWERFYASPSHPSQDAAPTPLRVLIIVGIAGIGKTVLAEQWLELSKPHYPHAMTLNFEYRPEANFADVAAYCLAQMHQPVLPGSQPQPQKLLEQWIAVLAEQPYLLVIDSLEGMLQGNEQNGWSEFRDEWWEAFFHRLLGMEQCASQIVITSQEVPAQVEVHGLRYSQRYHCEFLKGLDADAQKQFFQEHGLDCDDALSQSYLKRIGAAYEGHPLALRIISGEIVSLAEGDVAAYWNHYGHEIEALEQAQASPTPEATPTLRLDRYSRYLRRALRDRIEISFQRLRTDLPDAYLLLCSAAVYRAAMQEAFLLRAFLKRGWTEARSLVALDALLDRRLLEPDTIGQLRQHNLIRSVALDHLQGLTQPHHD